MTIIIPAWAVIALTAGLWVIILLKISVEVMQYRIAMSQRKCSIYDEAIKLLDAAEEEEELHVQGDE